MNEQRLRAIRRLIETNQIKNQQELKSLLESEGFKVTQATLSRDISKLNVRKERNNHGVLSYTLNTRMTESVSLTDLGESVTITFSNHLAVIRTKAGYANGIAGDIDAHQLSEVVGTIAGDDTILIIPRQDVSNDQLIAALRQLLPHLTINE